MRWLIAVSMLLLAAAAPQDDREVRQYYNAMGMALRDSATGKMVFYDHGGGRLLLEGMDYTRALARETLCPDKVVVRGTAVKRGQYRQAFIRKLGGPYRTVEPSVQRSSTENIAYFRRLVENNPNTMHYYAIVGAGVQVLDGWFQVVEWDLDSLGTVRVYFHAPEEKGPFIAELIHVKLNPVEHAPIERAPGDPYVLLRPGEPDVRWDFGQNILYIGAE